MPPPDLQPSDLNRYADRLKRLITRIPRIPEAAGSRKLLTDLWQDLTFLWMESDPQLGQEQWEALEAGIRDMEQGLDAILCRPPPEA